MATATAKRKNAEGITHPEDFPALIAARDKLAELTTKRYALEAREGEIESQLKQLPAGRSLVAAEDRPRAAAVGLHDPDFEPPGLVGLVCHAAPVGREDRIRLHRGQAGQRRERTGRYVHRPDVVGAGARRDYH